MKYKVHNLINYIFSSQFVRFGIVGILNTLIGAGVMLFAYNVLHCGYWISSALNYFIGSIFSFIANKYFTFKCKKQSIREIIRFTVNIMTCYLVAYGIAKPLVKCGLRKIGLGIDKGHTEQLAMICGMVLFVLLNYIGQKLFVFKNGRKEIDRIYM